MSQQNLYGSFVRIAQQRSQQYKPRLIVDQKTEQRILSEIKRLQQQDNELYENDDLSDEAEIEIKAKSKMLCDKIKQLIDSMYETKDQVNQRVNRYKYSK